MWEKSVVLGRDAGCDRVVDHEKMSKRHAEIHQRGSNWFVRDLGSTNGTTLNGIDCTQEQQLTDGSRLKIGGLFATFQVKEAAPEVSQGASRGPSSGVPESKRSPPCSKISGAPA